MTTTTARINHPAFIAGRRVETAQSLDVRAKHTDAVFARVALAGPAEIDRAIAAAHSARTAMASMPSDARAAAISAVRNALAPQRNELARLLALEAGKPVKAGISEIDRLLETLDIAAAEATRIAGDILPITHSPRTRGYTCFSRRVPVGVCSFITPFNFPLNLAAHKIGPAIAAGCPFVLKPADKTPVTTMALAEALMEANLPDGAWSVFACDLAHVAPLVEDERIALLSFTGSANVGWALKARAGRKRVVLELGGNAACIVDESANIEYAAARITAGAFGYSGQSCISAQRIYAHESIFADLRDAITECAGALIVGDPLDETTDIGPVIDDAAAQRIEAWIHEALDHGAALACGGSRDGRLVEPTVLTHTREDDNIMRCEAFGPVVALSPFTDFNDALARAGGSEFGLQAGVFTNRLDRAFRAWNALEVGGVIVNDASTFRADAAPYGGVKKSGAGREGVVSAIEHMTESRLLVVNTNANT